MAKTPEPSNATDQPTRRGLLGLTAALGAASVATAAPAMAAAEDPHLAWERELLENERLANETPLDDPDYDEEKCHARYRELLDHLFCTPPQTLAGAAALVRTVAFWGETSGCELDDGHFAALREAAHAVDRLAGRA